MNPGWWHKHRWPLVRWTLLLLALAGLGEGLFVWLPPAPRWVVPGQFALLGVTADGQTLRARTGEAAANALWIDPLSSVIGLGTGSMATYQRATVDWIDADVETVFVDDLAGTLSEVRGRHVLHGDFFGQGGPLQFLDVASGRETQRFFDDAGTLDSMLLTDDGRRLFAVARSGGEKPVAHLHRMDLDTGQDAHAVIETKSPRWRVRASPGAKLLVLHNARPFVVWDYDNDVTQEVRGEPVRKREPEARHLLLYDAESLRLLAKEDAADWHWQWAPNGDALLLYAAYDNGRASLRRITAQGEKVTLLDGAGAWRGISPDGKTLLTAWPATEAEDRDPSVLLWDVATGKRLGEVPRSDRNPPTSDMFFADGRTLVSTQDDGKSNPIAVVWSIDKHAALGSVPQSGRDIQVSRAHNLFALHGKDLALYRPQPFARLWQRELAGGEVRSIEFLGDTQFLLAETGGKDAQHVEVRNVPTGALRLGVQVLDQHRVVHRSRFLAVEERIALPPDTASPMKEYLDKFFALVLRAPISHADYKTVTRVFDIETGELLGRLELRGVTLADIAPDGRSLFMQEDGSTGSDGALRCYDLPPGHAWPWIFGAPLAVAALVVSLRTGWRWLRRPRARKPANAAIQNS